MRTQFYGNEVSDYGKAHGRVDYATLVKAFDCILNNGIIENTRDLIGEWDIWNGSECYHEDSEGNVLTEDQAIDKASDLADEQEDIENQIEAKEAEIEDIENNQLYDASDDEKLRLQAMIDQYTDDIEELNQKIEQIEDEIDQLEGEYYHEYYQYYIISEAGAEILSRETEETVWYNGELDMYVWGVTHYGTAWDMVLTSIEL